MTPLEIEILLRCHTTPEPHPCSKSTAGTSALSGLVRNGLIEADDVSYKTTTRGAAHVEQLCDTAWPTQAWVREDGTIITGDGL